MKNKNVKIELTYAELNYLSFILGIVLKDIKGKLHWNLYNKLVKNDDEKIQKPKKGENNENTQKLL